MRGSLDILEKRYPEQYPTEPIGGGNPYYRCRYCGRSEPEINGRLEGHARNCEWVEMRRLIKDLKER